LKLREEAIMVRARTVLLLIWAVVFGLGSAESATATGVPISGFYPFAGISLTTKHDDDSDPTFTFYQADYETSYLGTPLGVGGTPHFEVALVDTGAATSLITTAADAGFNIAGAGYRGTNPLPIGGATGSLVAITNDPMAIYASGLGPSNRSPSSPLTLNTGLMAGQSSISLATLPAESDLPSILGIPFSSQYATYIRNDQPQIFSLGGKTIRTPQLQFLPLGSGGQGITRRVPITLDDPNAFLSPPQYTFDFNNIIDNKPLTDNPLYPTLRLGSSGQPAAAYFVNVNVANKSNTLNSKPFLLDTGADISVVSEINAVNLGFDPVLDTPDFTETVLGSGGTLEKVPGFYVDQLTIPAVGGTITLSHVPFIVLDFPNPSHIGNVAEGLIGMNALAGRNLVIDPNPSTGGGGNNPSLYVSDPVTTNHNWSNANATGAWSTTSNWAIAGTPDVLWIANVRNLSGSAQEAVVSADSTIWELNVSGAGAATMNVRITSGVTLTTFSGANIETGGEVRLQNGTLSAQYVDIRGGTLSGNGTILTGSGPITGQVENHNGVVAPRDGAAPTIGSLTIDGRLANDEAGTLAIDLGGTIGTQYDRIVVTGDAALDGTLAISLVPGYIPSIGNLFTILSATGDVGGTFSHVQGPDGYNWRVNYLASSLQVVVGNPGDFNNDGIVDARDYVLWRKNSGGPLNFAAWRSHFGTTYSNGAASGLATGVPEPSCVLLIASAACVLARRRKRNA
jgi:hypothetical protein